MKKGLTVRRVSPCKARNLFEIVSGGSCSPFPYKSLVQNCQLHFLYATIQCSWHLDSGPTKTQGHSRSLKHRSFSRELSQLHQREFLLFLSRPDGWMEVFLLLLCFCFVVFLTTSNYSKAK